MHKLAYLVLLALAFVVGLVGTVAASQALVDSVSQPNRGVRAVENDTALPAHVPAYDVPTVEC